MKSVNIKDVKIPFLIHKRNKGHVDVTGSFSFRLEGPPADPCEFLLYMTKYSRALITVETLEEISHDINAAFSPTQFSLELSFGYLIDRVSANYLVAPYELRCGFISEKCAGISKSGLFVEVPVRIKKFYNSEGLLKYTATAPNTLYFEDLFDHITKHCHTRIYPVLSVSDKHSLTDAIDSGLDPQEYLKILRKSPLGTGGTASIFVKDVYDMYTMEIKETW